MKFQPIRKHLDNLHHYHEDRFMSGGGPRLPIKSITYVIIHVFILQTLY